MANFTTFCVPNIKQVPCQVSEIGVSATIRAQTVQLGNTAYVGSDLYEDKMKLIFGLDLSFCLPYIVTVETITTKTIQRAMKVKTTADYRKEMRSILILLEINTSAYLWSVHGFNDNPDRYSLGFFPSENSDYVEIHQGTIQSCVEEGINKLASIAATRALEARIVEAQ